MDSEEWRPVVGWEGMYEVSSEGRVRSLDRRTPNQLCNTTSLVKGRVLRLKRGKVYLRVNLSQNGKVTTCNVHRLVCEAFHGPAPEGKPLALHGPNGKEDNRASNLRWGSNSDNMYDRRRDGTDPMVNRTHCPQRHEYTPENTRFEGGIRRCVTCRRASSKAAYWNRKEREDDGSA